MRRHPEAATRTVIASARHTGETAFDATLEALGAGTGMLIQA